MNDFDVIVVGGGLAGLSAAIAAESLGATALVLEAEDDIGGLARSVRHDGYKFDYSGHLLHLARPETRELVFAAVEPSQWTWHDRRSAVVLGDHFVPYPFQLHLAHAPPAVRDECLTTLPNLAREVPADPGSLLLSDWIEGWLGAGIGKHFMTPYNQKVSGVDTDDLTCHWLGRFVPQPSIDEIREGGSSDRVLEAGYNARFLYPTEGGIDILPRALADRVSWIQKGARVAEIDPSRRLVRTASGSVYRYRHGVLATAPLPEVRRMTLGGTRTQYGLAALLRANSVMCVNLGLKYLSGDFSRFQWLYLPEDKFTSYRIGFYNGFSERMSPKGRFGVYVEITRRNQLDSDELFLRDAVADLVQLGVIRGSEDVEVAAVAALPHAYVLHDTSWANSRSATLASLAEEHILTAGRYGRWEYASMEDALWQGIEQVQALLEVPQTP